MKRSITAATATVALLAPLVATSSAQAPSSAGACPPPPLPTSAPSTITSPEPAQPAPEQVLACVSSQAIAGATFAHWEVIAEKGEPTVPSRPPDSTVVRKQVMEFLISSYWVLGEALDLKVHVSALEVQRSFDHTRKEQFPRHGEFAAFLRSSGETVTDLLFRVRLNLTSARIQEHIISDHHGARSQQRALVRFVRDFRSKWRGQTYCTAMYAVPDCGHVQSLP